jgi:hypothetical protein
MEREPSTTPTETPETETSYERLPAPMSGVFNFEALEPDEAAELLATLDKASNAAEEQALRTTGNVVSYEPGYGQRNFLYSFDADLGAYSSDNPERAHKFFDALRTRADSNHARGTSASAVAPQLVRHYADDYVKRQPIIDAWVELLHDDDPIVRETTAEAMSDAVDSDWLDDQTARYLDAMLPAGYQREDWRQ